MPIDGNIRSAGIGKVVLAMVLVAAAGIVFISRSDALALAADSRQHRTFDVNFTKWETRLPAGHATFAGVLMAGRVGGEVGRGRYAEQILSDDTTVQPRLWLGHARYAFTGSAHSFVADVHITENDTRLPIIATIRGIVTAGWLKGAQITGNYRQWDPCPIPTAGNKAGRACYQGILQLEPAPSE